MTRNLHRVTDATSHPAPRITLRRILRDWSVADDAPIAVDEFDRLGELAAGRLQRRPA